MTTNSELSTCPKVNPSQSPAGYAPHRSRADYKSDPVAALILWIYPLLWMFSASLKTNAEIFAASGAARDLAAEEYQRAWEQAHIRRYFANTVIITVSS